MTELVNKLPFELANIIYSYVGEHKNAEMIKKAEDEITEAHCWLLDFYNQEGKSFYEKYFETYNFLHQIHGTKKVNTHEFLYHTHNELYKCYYCNKMLYKDDIVNYNFECEFCHARKLGTEVYECQGCGDRTFEGMNMSEYQHKLYCEFCYESLIEEALEEENEENEE